MSNKESKKKDEYSKFEQYQRVGIFVDVQNMFYSAKRINNGRLDFAKLMESAVRGRQLKRALCYIVDNPDVDQDNFVDMLKNNGYEIKTKTLRKRADGSSKGDWDMGLAIDAISLADKIDIMVLVSGDGDFTDLVYYLKSRGLKVEVFSFLESTNDDLVESCDQHFVIDEKMLLKEKRKK